MPVRKSTQERYDASLEQAQKRLATAKKRYVKALTRVTKVRGSAAPSEDAFAAAEIEVATAQAYLEWVKSMPTGPAVAAPSEQPAEPDEDDDEEYYDDDDDEEDEGDVPA